MDITTSAANSNITVTPNGEGTLALGTGTNTAVNVTGDKILLTGDGTDVDAIKLNSDGGIQAFVAEEKILELGNAGQDTYLRITPGVAANEKIEVKNTAGDQADAIALTAVAGGILARVADTKTLVLGNNPASTADTYVKVAPSSVPGDEKIEILNTAGTADDAIALTAVAGGILGLSLIHI